MKKLISLILALMLVLSCSAALASEPVTLVYAEVNPLDSIVGKTAMTLPIRLSCSCAKFC